MSAWGFDYRTNLVWVKDRIGLGIWARNRHELLLCGVRGSFSPPEPDERPDSVIEAPRRKHSQKPDCVYAESQEQWRIVRRFSDQASGASLERPGLERMLVEGRAQRFDLLLVYRVDRLSRSVRGLAQLLEQLDEAGVLFRSASEPFDTSSSAGRMMVQMLGVFAEFERAHDRRARHLRDGAEGQLFDHRAGQCPRPESNQRTRFRKPLLYPLSYGGAGSAYRRRRRRKGAAAGCAELAVAIRSR
jgi:hypothetical protein